MALWPYRAEALASRLRTWVWRLRGLSAGAGASVHADVRLRFERGAARLGERSVLYRGVRILATNGGRFEIGRDTHLAPDAYVLVGGQSLSIGDDVAIGPGLMVFCESNDYRHDVRNDSRGAGEALPFRQQYRRAPVSIGRNVFIGARVTVLPGAIVEDDVVIAAHAVVSGRLASGWLYGGSPARPLKRLELLRPSSPGETSAEAEA